MIRDRKGIIGLMLTMALGVALGAAALVVGKEVAKGYDKNQASQPQGKTASGLSPAVDAAMTEFLNAQKAYEDAVFNRSPDWPQKKAAMKTARLHLEQALLGTQGIPATGANQGSSSSNQGTTVSTTPNPFGEDSITPSTNTPQPGNSQSTSTGLPPASTGTPPSNGEGTTPVSTPTAPTSGNSQNNISLEYYQVRSGDSLWKICQQYYGDGGMWTHILQYQIPSIAACPNLIFPGQLIALPRGLTTGIPSPGTTSSGNIGNGSTGSNEIAPPGDDSWEETFQKDYLISDHDFTDTTTMSVAQIQAFLEKKGSCLAKPYRGGSPAQMIYNAALKYGINPQVILTRLQCEQGLISKKSATEKQLDWAVGVGCYDSGNWNQKFKGFDKQIEGAAATYKRHYDDAKKKLDAGQNITMNIDGQTVKVKNAATYSFYKYCPHFNGNKLFFDVWRGFRNKFK